MKHNPNIMDLIAAHLPGPVSNADRDLGVRLTRLASTHIRLQTEGANGVRRDRDVYNREVERVEARLTRMVATLPGGPWAIEFEGRGGGLCVVLALKSDPERFHWYVGNR